jgi:hypothetical protein
VFDHAVEERFLKPREPGAGAGARVACRPTASTGRVASGEGSEMAQSGDEVNQQSAPKVGRNDPSPCGSEKKCKRCGGAMVN